MLWFGAHLINFLLFAFNFLALRLEISVIKSYQLNKSAIKKREKGQSFREWLFYTRFKEEIPKFFLILYFSGIIIHILIFVVITILFSALEIVKADIYSRGILKYTAYYEGIWAIISSLMFWTNKPWEAHVYARWITKRKGQPPKKKKKWPRK